MSLEQRLQQALDQRRQQDLYRSRLTVASAQDRQIAIADKQLLNFCSNDYLGLANHAVLKQAAIKATEQMGVGSGASHLVNGHNQLHHQFEQALADWLGYERVLLFNSGFSANTALLQTLAQKGDLIVQDKLNHASLIDGALHSSATLKRYRHNDSEHLLRLIASGEHAAHSQRFIVTDGVFSMDGDIAPLPELAAIAQQHQASLIVDDAHGLGVLGATGKGCIEHFGLTATDVPILMGTLGKAFGSYGAFVAASEAVIEYLIQFARPYIYTTATPASCAAAGLAALQLIQSDSQRRQRLQGNINYFKQQAQQIGLNLMASDTAIQPIIVGEAAKALAMSAFLHDNNVLVSAIRPPTVPQGSARLRITLTANHSQQDIDDLIDCLKRYH